VICTTILAKSSTLGVLPKALAMACPKRPKHTPTAPISAPPMSKSRRMLADFVGYGDNSPADIGKLAQSSFILVREGCSSNTAGGKTSQTQSRNRLCESTITANIARPIISDVQIQPLAAMVWVCAFGLPDLDLLQATGHSNMQGGSYVVEIFSRFGAVVVGSTTV
jgi:hypothetical protein